MSDNQDWQTQFIPTKDKILNFIREETQLRPLDGNARSVTLKEIVEISGVSYLTTRKYVKELLDEKLIDVIRHVGRAYHFYAVVK